MTPGGIGEGGGVGVLSDPPVAPGADPARNNVLLAKTDDFSSNGFPARWAQRLGTGAVVAGKLQDDAEWTDIGIHIEGCMVVKFDRAASMSTLSNGVAIWQSGSDDNYSVFLEENTADNLRFLSRFRIGGSSFTHITGPNIPVGNFATFPVAWMRCQRIGHVLVCELFDADPDLGTSVRKGAPMTTDIAAAGAGDNFDDGRWGVRSRAANARADLARWYNAVV